MRYSIAIKDRQTKKTEHYKTDGCLLVMESEEGAEAVVHLHELLQTGLVLVGCSQVCERIFEKHPEQKEVVKLLLKRTGEPIEYDI